MYRIYCDDLCIYDPSGEGYTKQVANPKLQLADNVAGSLSFMLPPTNIGYGRYQIFRSTITVYNDAQVFWKGRIVTDAEDFNKCHTIECEGALAFLNDTVQPAGAGTIAQILNTHNSRVTSDRQIKMGVDPSPNTAYKLNYESTFEVLNKIVKDNDWHFWVVYASDGIYLNILTEYLSNNTQTIEFGKNLLDFTSTFDVTDLTTCIIPRGHLSKDEETGVESYVNISSVNGGSIYLESLKLTAMYGLVEKTVDWPNVYQAGNLLSLAQKYLSDYQFDGLVLEVSVLDLHIINPEIQNISLLDMVRCVSVPHGMDRYFPVTKMNIDLSKPDGTVITLNKEKSEALSEQASDISDSVSDQINKVEEKIDNIEFDIDVDEETILDKAKKEASELINSATGGYVTMVLDETGKYVEEMVISNDPDWTKADRYWRWNVNGLGYFDKNAEPQNLKVAMTMDGQIVADMITTGTMKAERIRGGTLALGAYDKFDGEIVIYDSGLDEDGNPILDKETGEEVGPQEIGRWDKNGFVATRGELSGALHTYSETFDEGTSITAGNILFHKGSSQNGNYEEIGRIMPRDTVYFVEKQTETATVYTTVEAIRIDGKQGISLDAPLIAVVSEEYDPTAEAAYLTKYELTHSGELTVITGVNEDGSFVTKTLRFNKGLLVSDLEATDTPVIPDVPSAGQKALEDEYANIFWRIEDTISNPNNYGYSAATYTYQNTKDYMLESYPLANQYRANSAENVPYQNGYVFYHPDENAYYNDGQKLAAYPMVLSVPQPIIHGCYVLYVGKHDGKWYVSDILKIATDLPNMWKSTGPTANMIYYNANIIADGSFTEYTDDLILAYAQKHGYDDDAGNISQTSCSQPYPAWQFYWEGTSLKVIASIGYVARWDSSKKRALTTRLYTEGHSQYGYEFVMKPEADSLNVTEITAECYRSCIYIVSENARSYAEEFRNKLVNPQEDI